MDYLNRVMEPPIRPDEEDEDDDDEEEGIAAPVVKI